jgi:hypothetical protein
VLAKHSEAEHNVALDTQWIDMRRIKAWIQHCQDYHAGHCHSISDPWRSIAPPEAILLINVERHCLEPCPGSQSYIALSYMWGQIADPLTTLRANFEELCEEGAFRSPIVFKRMPNTIRDVIALTSILGQTHVWIDRFCIIQDDRDHKTAQLEAMASIYANSFITIIAAEGNDDTFGLRGIVTNGLPRASPFHQFDFAPECRLITNPPLVTSRYRTRGWTFQEEILSPRKLEFSSGTVVWKCRRTSREEQLAIPEQLPRTIKQDLDHDDLFTAWPNIRAFAATALAYSERQLTYASDAMNAFSAIVTVFSRSMHGGFLHGTPELFFDGMLLWQPYSPLERRKDAKGNVVKAFPSWSWIGWTGKLDARMWTEGHQFVTKEEAFPSYLSIHPTVVWHKRTTDGEKLVRVESNYYTQSDETPDKLDKFSIASSHILPPGWRFTQSLPLASQPLAGTQSDGTAVIEFRTECMSLSLGARTHEFGYCASGLLEDAHGRIVGAIRLNSMDWIIGESCDLISISRAEAECNTEPCYAEAMFPELENENFRQELWKSATASSYMDVTGNMAKETQGHPKTSRLYNFYNVLWIAWEGNIAYRVALGRVEQGFWDSAVLKDIDVRLG